MNKIYLKHKDCSKILDFYSNNNELDYNHFFKQVKINLSDFLTLIEKIY